MRLIYIHTSERYYLSSETLKPLSVGSETDSALRPLEQIKMFPFYVLLVLLWWYPYAPSPWCFRFFPQNEIEHRTEESLASPQHAGPQPAYNAAANVHCHPFSFGTLLLHLTLIWMKLIRQETQASQMLFPALYSKISTRIIWVSLRGMVLWTHCLTSMGHGTTTHHKIRTPCVTICEAAVDMHYDGHWRWEPCEDLIVLYLGPFKYSQSGLHWLEPLESHICWLREPHLFVMMCLSSMSWLPPAMCLCAKLLGNRITKL